MKTVRTQIGSHLVREKCGIVEQLVCIRCGKNLPWFSWDCPNCDKPKEV